MIITESWWTSQSAEALKQVPYLSLFNGVTGSAGYGYGAALRKNLDASGNVSYVIGTPSDLLSNLDQGLTKPTLSDTEGARAAFNWYPDYSVPPAVLSAPKASITLPGRSRKAMDKPKAAQPKIVFIGRRFPKS